MNTLSRAVGKLRFQAGASILAASMVGIGLGASRAEMDELYEPGQAIGEGLKGEIWKAKHRKTHVLELDHDPAKLMLTYLRDAETSEQAFITQADMMIRCLLSFAALELPINEEAVVTTPIGAKFKGSKIEDNIRLLAVYMCGPEHHSKAYFHKGFTDVFPDAQSHEIIVKNGSVFSDTLPHNAGKKFSHAILLVPSIGSGDAEIAGINLLKQKDFAEDAIILTAIVSSFQGINNVNKECTGVSIVVGAVDPLLTPEGRIIPGVGDFTDRYTAALFSLKPKEVASRKPTPPHGDGSNVSWFGWVIRFVWPR